MKPLFEILGFAFFIFWLLLIARIVVEFIRSFSRDWHPRGVTVVILEAIMTVTDPPVKLLRRIIPQLTIGAVRLDLRPSRRPGIGELMKIVLNSAHVCNRRVWCDRMDASYSSERPRKPFYTAERSTPPSQIGRGRQCH